VGWLKKRFRDPRGLSDILVYICLITNQHKKMIEEFEVTEGNLKAVKDTSGFGGTNKWKLEILTPGGRWRLVQWMSVCNIQEFFKANLPTYEETDSFRN